MGPQDNDKQFIWNNSPSTWYITGAQYMVGILPMITQVKCKGSSGLMTQKSTRAHQFYHKLHGKPQSIKWANPVKSTRVDWKRFLPSLFCWWHMNQRETMSLEDYTNCFPVILRMECAVCHCCGSGYNRIGRNCISLSELTHHFLSTTVLFSLDKMQWYDVKSKGGVSASLDV